MKATSFRFTADTIELLNRLRLPGESQAGVIARALALLDGQPKPLSIEALALRIAEIETRLAALETYRRREVVEVDQIGTSTSEVTDVGYPVDVDQIGTEGAVVVETVRDVAHLLAVEVGSDPERVSAQTRAAELQAAGQSTRQIAAVLNTEGFPTVSGRGQWQFGTVAALLRKHKAAGSGNGTADE